MTTNIMNCDLLVIGAGGSGLIAAVKAADLGVKNVIVLEKGKKAGGATMFAHGNFGLSGSKLEKTSSEAAGNNAGTAAQASNPMRMGSPGSDSQGKLYDWLVEKGGMDEYFRVAKPDARMPGGMGGRVEQFKILDKYKNHPDASIGPGWGGSYIVIKMLELCDKMGIPILTETRAREFITDADGKVTGVLADTKDGRLLVNCRACFIGAGGFGADYAKCQKRWPEHFNNKTLLCLAPHTLTGDGIDMAQKIGADIDVESQWVSVGGPAHHPYSYTIYRIMRQPEVVYVNLNGERWLDETKELPGGYNALALQPKAEMYAIADNDLVETLGNRLIANPDAETDIPILKKFREDIAYEVSLDDGGAKGSHTKKADTLIDLAVQMEINPEVFVATIEKYNQYCEKKQDPDFGKKAEYLVPIRKPPFYAFFGQRFSQCTHGGIVVNLNTEVFDVKGNIMPGLFAGGDCTTVNGRGEGGMAWAPMGGYFGGIATAKYLAAL